MATDHKPTGDRSLMNMLSTVLILPVALCAAIGGVFLWTKDDPAHGLTLIGLATLLGFTNFLIIKYMVRKLAQADSPDQGDAS